MGELPGPCSGMDCLAACCGAACLGDSGMDCLAARAARSRSPHAHKQTRAPPSPRPAAHPGAMGETNQKANTEPASPPNEGTGEMARVARGEKIKTQPVAGRTPRGVAGRSGDGGTKSGRGDRGDGFLHPPHGTPWPCGAACCGMMLVTDGGACSEGGDVAPPARPQPPMRQCTVAPGQRAGQGGKGSGALPLPSPPAPSPDATTRQRTVPAGEECAWRMGVGHSLHTCLGATGGGCCSGTGTACCVDCPAWAATTSAQMNATVFMGFE